MSGRYTRETFFRPRSVERSRSALPARIYNAFHLLLARSATGCVFVPIRSMQYQAVIEREEVIFVDNHGGYAQQDGEGGRLIQIAWQPLLEGARESLDKPVPCDLVFYFPDLKETQRRLLSEIQPALELVLERQREHPSSESERRVLPFRRTP
jgi:hypothetical protein